MNIWPWSEISSLRRQIDFLEAELEWYRNVTSDLNAEIDLVRLDLLEAKRKQTATTHSTNYR